MITKKRLIMVIGLLYLTLNAGCSSTNKEFVVGTDEMVFGKAGEQPPTINQDWALVSRNYWKFKVEKCQ